MNKPALTFGVYGGEQLLRRETLQQEIIKIGRDPKSHLRVADGAARMHAVLEAVSCDELTLIDLGNEPGTLVNGQRVNRCKLHVGDSVQIGGTRFVLEAATDRADAATVTPPAPAPAIPIFDASAPLFAPAAPLFAPLASSNPFVATAVPALAAPSAILTQPLGPSDYAMIKSAPSPLAEEVEQADVSAVEVLVRWDSNVLHVAHLSPVRSFYVGERDAKGEGTDFLLPADVIGADRIPIVSARGQSAWLIVPAGATGSVTIPGQPEANLADLVAHGRAKPSVEVSGAHEIELVAGLRAKVVLDKGGISFEVATVTAGKKVAAGFLASLEATVLRHVGLSLFAHLGIIASLAFFLPKMAADDTESIDRDFMARMLHASDTRAEEERAKLEEEKDANSQPSGGTGEASRGEAGALGDPNKAPAKLHYTFAGPRDNPDPKLARERALQEARDWGVAGLIAMDRGVVNAPVNPWSDEGAQGRDAENHLGQMWGEAAGDAWGMGGLTLTGAGQGGGGNGFGIGLDTSGGLGRGAGCKEAPGHPCGQGFGPGGEGWSHGRMQREHDAKAPPMPRAGTPEINGRLPKEVIQRIVRQNFGRFRVCYESGLRGNPSLEGRVAVKFVIGRDGAVMTAADGGSDLPDQNVVGCVTRAFQNLSFPSPEGGLVTVIYPLVFNPGS